jgi:hypothetical protein
MKQSVSVDAPIEVVVGQTFALSVTVTNERSRKVLLLSDVDTWEVGRSFSPLAILTRRRSPNGFWIEKNKRAAAVT